MESAPCKVALARLDVLDRRLAADVAAAQAVNPAVGLVLQCLRLQLLVAAERLLAMASNGATEHDIIAQARTLLVAYESAIIDARGAVIRASLPRAA